MIPQFGENSTVLKEAGLTQWDVARLLDKPQSFVSKAETGERRLDEMRHIAEIYGKTLDYFV